MMDFADALDSGAREYEEARLMPIGTYTWTVTKAPETKVVGADNNWDMVTFFVKCIAPEDDVDPDDLADYGTVANNPSRVTFLFTKNPDEQNDWNKTRAQLDKFLFNVLQVDVEESAPLKEAMAASVNCQFLGVMKHSPDKRSPGTFQEDMGSMAPVS